MWNNYIVKNNILDYKRPKQNLSASYSYYEKEYGFGFNLNWKFKSKSEYERFNELGTLETFFQDSYNLCNASFSRNFIKLILQSNLVLKIFSMLKIFNLVYRKDFMIKRM